MKRTFPIFILGASLLLCSCSTQMHTEFRGSLAGVGKCSHRKKTKIDIGSHMSGELVSGERFILLSLDPCEASFLLAYRPPQTIVPRLQTQLPSALAKVWIIDDPHVSARRTPVKHAEDFLSRRSWPMTGPITIEFANVNDFTVAVDLRGQNKPDTRVFGRFSSGKRLEYDSNYVGLLLLPFASLGSGPATAPQHDTNGT